MFGYVTVYKPELKIKDYDTYKGVYCTLCKTMQKEYGFLSRFLLSYDATFYAVYKMGTSKNCTKLSKSHCSFNPCKKCLKIESDEEIFKKAAAITVILSYFKLCDNISDENFFKKLLCKAVKPYFSHLVKKAKKKYLHFFNAIEKYMGEQGKIEKEDLNLDASADPTGKALGYILSDGNIDSNDYKVGYFLGRTVYLLDAFDDYKKDIKSNSYNPFKNTNDIIDDASFAINMSIGETAEYLKNIELFRFKDIIENIIYFGLKYQIKKITNKLRGEKDEWCIFYFRCFS